MSPEVNVTETRSHSTEKVWATIEFSCPEGLAVEETFASSSLIRAQYVHQGAYVPLTSVRVCQPNGSKVIHLKDLMDLSGNVDSCGSGVWSDFCSPKIKANGIRS